MPTKTEISTAWNTYYRDCVTDLLDKRIGIDFDDQQKDEINNLINHALRNIEYLSKDYNSFLYFCGMWGFKLSDHFELYVV